MALDQYKQRAQEEAAAAAPEKPQEHTLSETLADTEESKLFGEMLRSEGSVGEELATKLGKPEDVKPGDIKDIEERHTKFIERMREAKDMGEKIDKDTIVEMAKGNPFLSQQLKIMKPEQLAQIFKKQLSSIAIKDESRFNGIKKAFDVAQGYRDGQYKKLDEKVEKICSDNKLDVSQFVEIMRNPNANERIELFRKEIKAAYGFKNFITAGLYSVYKAKALDDKGKLKASIDGAMKQMDKHIQGIGAVLGASVELNDEVREAFMREAIGDREPKKSEQSFKEMSSDSMTPKKAQEAWAKEKGSGAYKALTDDTARQTHLDNWKKGREYGAEKEAAEKGGFWAKIAAALIKALFAKEKFDL